MQPKYFRCAGCGWKSLGTGDLTYEGTESKEFIRVDKIEQRGD